MLADSIVALVSTHESFNVHLDPFSMLTCVENPHTTGNASAGVADVSTFNSAAGATSRTQRTSQRRRSTAVFPEGRRNAAS